MESKLSSTTRKIMRPLYAEFLDRLDKDDDGGNFTTADERHETLRIAKTFYDKEAPRPGKHGSIQNSDQVSKMARQMNPGTLLLTFEFYAALFAPHQQLIKKVPTYSEIKFANNTLSQGELMCFCSDFNITPDIVSKQDIRHIWPYIQEQHSGVGGVNHAKRIGKELSVEGFKQFLCRVALVNMVSPEGRKVVLSKKRQAHEAVLKLCEFLGFHDKKFIKNKIKVSGAATQNRLAGSIGMADGGNPYTKHDSKRFTMVWPPKKEKNDIESMIKAANEKKAKRKGSGIGNSGRALDSGLYKSAMGYYMNSLKAIFAPFESEPVLNEWEVFLRDRPSGQVCRPYIDCGEIILKTAYKYQVILVNQSKYTVKLHEPFIEPEEADRNIRLSAKYEPNLVKAGRKCKVTLTLFVPHHIEYNASLVFTATRYFKNSQEANAAGKTLKSLVRCPLYVISYGAHHGENKKPREALTLRERMTMRFPENGGGDIDDLSDEASDSDGYGDAEEETEEEESFRKRQELKAKLRGPYVQDLERKTAEMWDEIHKYKQQKTLNNINASVVGRQNVADLMKLSLVGRKPGTMPIVPPFEQILKMEILSPSPNFVDPSRTPKWMVNGEMSAPQELNEDGSVKIVHGNTKTPTVVSKLMGSNTGSRRQRRRKRRLPFLPPIASYCPIDFRKDGDVYRVIHGKSLIGKTSSTSTLTLPNHPNFVIKRSQSAQVLANRKERIAIVRAKSSGRISRM